MRGQKHTFVTFHISAPPPPSSNPPPLVAGFALVRRQWGVTAASDLDGGGSGVAEKSPPAMNQCRWRREPAL